MRDCVPNQLRAGNWNLEDELSARSTFHFLPTLAFILPGYAKLIAMLGLRRNWPILLVLLFPLIPLWRAVFLGEAIGPFDQIRQMAPWNEPMPERPWDVLQADGALQFFAWRDLVFEAWGKGQLPLWNPYQLAGTPLLANSQSGAFYPPHIAMGMLHVPTKVAMTFLAWFHLAWAGLGLMALARRLGASKEGAALGGIAFAGSAFMIAWTGLPSVISTCAWIPWVLAAVFGLFEPASGRTWARRGAFLAFSVGMMVLAGHLQFAFYGLLAAGGLIVLRSITAYYSKGEVEPEELEPGPRRLRRLRRPPHQGPAETPAAVPRTSWGRIVGTAGIGFTAIGIGLGLAAPQLLPVLEYSKQSHRRNVPSAEGYEAYVAGGIAPFELVGLVYPMSVGAPFEFAPSDKPLSQYWPSLVKRGSNFAEGAIGFGPLVLLGLFLFPWRGRSKANWAPLAALSVFALFISLGTPLNRLLYFGIPGWSSTGSPGRMGVLFVMGLCAMAAVGLSQTHWTRLRPSRWAYSAFGVAGLTLATVFALISLGGSMAPRFEGMDPNLVKRLVSISLGSTLWSALVAGLLAVVGYVLLRSRSDSKIQPAPMVFGAVGALVLLGFARLYCGFVPTSPTAYAKTGDLEVPTLSRITGINDPWELIVAAPAVLPPNTASALRIHDLAGYDSLLDSQTHQLLGLIDGQDPAPPANGNMQFIKPTADPSKLAAAGVSYVLARTEVFPKLQPTSMESGLLRYKLDGPGRAYTFAGPARIVDGFDRQTVTALGPGLLTVKDRNMAGWRAYLNGKEQPIADGIWRVIDLPAGEHVVEFVYEAPGLRTGMLAFLPCLLACLGGAVWGRKS